MSFPVCSSSRTKCTHSSSDFRLSTVMSSYGGHICAACFSMPTRQDGAESRLFRETLVELVANPSNCDNKFRALRIGLYFFTKITNIDHDGFRVIVHALGFPNLFKYLLCGENLSGIFNEHLENFKSMVVKLTSLLPMNSS